MRPGLEGCQLLPFQLLGPLGWIETSIGQPPDSTKLAKFSEVMIAHPCELEGRVGWSHHLPVELQFLHWCLRKLRVQLGGKLPRVAGLYSVITASWSMAIASSISYSGAKTFCSNAALARSDQKDRGSGIRWREAIFCPRACCAKFCSLAFSMLV